VLHWELFIRIEVDAQAAGHPELEEALLHAESGF